VYESSGISPALSSQIGNASNGSILIQQKGRGFNKGGRHKICPTISSHAFQQNNFVSEPKHKHGEERIYEKIVGTLTSRMGTGGDNIPYVNNIRRLTEIECERLQGFPDDWTKFGDYDGTVKKICKTQRYKMIGNAVSTVVVQEVGNKLIQL